MSQRRVNIQRFTGDGYLTLGGFEFEGTHVVQAVSQLDEHHADILTHGQDHLAQRFGLTLLAVGKVQLIQLCNAVYQAGNLFAEHFGNGGKGYVLAVLHRIMQKTRGDGRRINTDLREDAGHIRGMHKIGFAAQTRLPQVLLLCKCIGARNQVGIGVGMIMLETLEHLLKLHAYINGTHQVTLPSRRMSLYRGSFSGEVFSMGKSCGAGARAISPMFSRMCAAAAF